MPASKRHARPCAGHPRLLRRPAAKTWMAGTSPAVTEERNRRRLELICQSDQAELQRVAEVTSVVCGRAKIEICRAAASNGSRPKVDVTEFGPSGPMRGKHVLDANTRRPADFRFVLCEGGQSGGGGTPEFKAVLHVTKGHAAGDIDECGIKREAAAAAKRGQPITS